MVFRISTDIVDIAEQPESRLHDICIDIINQLGRAYMRGLHLLYAEKEQLRRIISIPEVDRSAKKIYGHIVEKKYTWLRSVVNAINFHVLITTGRESSRDDSCIVLNPEDFPDFYFEKHINLICENIRDADFYSIVGKKTAAQRRMSSDLKITYNNDTGNGANTAQKVESRHRDSDGLFLAILDSDRHYGDPDIDSVPVGDTAGTVMRYFEEAADGVTLGKYYVLRHVSEIENLVPLKAVSKLRKNLGDIRNVPEEALCWYDMKKGISCKHVRKGKMCRDYWLNVYSENTSVTERINRAVECTSECRECKRPMRITTNFGASLLEEILDSGNYDELLYDKNMRYLTNHQKEEWQQVGQLMIEWCCAPPKIRV